MKIKKAYKILRKHNNWRRGKGIEQVSPTKLGIAIDVILEYLQNKL